MDMSNFMAAQEPGQVTLREVMVAQALAEDAAKAADALDVDAAHRLDEIAWQINMRESRARQVFKQTALEIGEYLTEAQGICPRGRWGEWLRAKVDYSERKAQQLMQVYQGYRDRQLTEDYDALSFTQIYQLLSAPEEARDALAKKAAEEELSTRELKEEIERLRDEIDQKQQRMDIETADAYREGAAHGAEASLEEIKALRLRVEKAEDDKRVAEAKAISAEASMGAIRDTAARANTRAAEAEESLMEMRRMHAAAENDLKKARAELKEALNREPERVEVVPEDVETEIAEMKKHIRKLEAENDRLRAAQAETEAAVEPPPGAVEAAMARAKAAITDAVAAIKGAMETRPSEAARAKNELMLICTAIAKKLGGQAQ